MFLVPNALNASVGFPALQRKNLTAAFLSTHPKKKKKKHSDISTKDPLLLTQKQSGSIFDFL